jgi:leader peptidase (prepilin peptidase)/N-methyltransferase
MTTAWGAVLAVLLGCVVGSFLNVVRYRLPRAMNLVSDRSACPGCHHTIAWHDNVPVVSFIALRRRCRHCGWLIPWIYPVVELSTGAAFLLVWLNYAAWHAIGATALAPHLVLTCLLVACAGIDYDLRIIPDRLTLPGIGLGVVFSLTLLKRGTLAGSLLHSLAGIAVGGGTLYLVAIAYKRVRGIEGMGGGDIKLMAMVGAFLGWTGALITIFLGSLAGALIGLILIGRSGKDLKTSVPFGVFLSPAAIAVMLWGERLLHWYLVLVRGPISP